MWSSAAVLLASIFALSLSPIWAQAQANPSTPTTTSSAAASTKTVMVANSGALTFTPNEITAPAGSIVEFRFATSGHTVSLNPPDSPCGKVVGASNLPDSGIVTATGFVWQWMIKNASQPILFHCNTPGHCAAGMIGTVNAAAGTAATLQTAAKSNPSPTSTDQNFGLLVAAAFSAVGSPGAPSSSSSSSGSFSTGNVTSPSSTTKYNDGHLGAAIRLWRVSAVIGFGTVLGLLA